MFNVCLISHDLHREEAICQIANTLEYLDQTFEQVFGRINDSIQQAREQINSFDSRINLIDTKINTIKGSKKAIQICSSSKYPILNDDSDEIQIQNENNDNFYDSIKFTEYKSKTESKWKNLFHSDKPFEMKHKLHKYQTPYAPLDELAFKNKLQEFSVDKVFKYDSITHQDGLGSVLSDHIKSVSSLLLFNTAQHPYKHSDLKDPLGDLDLKKNKKSLYDQSDRNDIYEAPLSILKGDQMEGLKKESLTYKPELGLVPDFNVPAFLPELSGIADLTYAQELPSIAPSNLITDDLPDILPEINTANLPEEITSLPSISVSTLNTNINIAPPPPPPPPTMSFSPPPPPPPPMVIQASSSAPPPPPPPPPMAVEERESVPVGNDEPEDTRNELLNAIRGFAGGKSKLKTIENRKKDNKQKKKEAKETGNLSLTDHLKQQLAIRRQFMDVKKEEEEKKGRFIACSEREQVKYG